MAGKKAKDRRGAGPFGGSSTDSTARAPSLPSANGAASPVVNPDPAAPAPMDNSSASTNVQAPAATPPPSMNYSAAVKNSTNTQGDPQGASQSSDDSGKRGFVDNVKGAVASWFGFGFGSSGTKPPTLDDDLDLSHLVASMTSAITTSSDVAIGFVAFYNGLNALDDLNRHAPKPFSDIRKALLPTVVIAFSDALIEAIRHHCQHEPETAVPMLALTIRLARLTPYLTDRNAITKISDAIGAARVYTDKLLVPPLSPLNGDGDDAPGARLVHWLTLKWNRNGSADRQMLEGMLTVMDELRTQRIDRFLNTPLSNVVHSAAYSMTLLVVMLSCEIIRYARYPASGTKLNHSKSEFNISH